MLRSPAPPLGFQTCCWVTLGNLVNLSVAQLSHWETRILIIHSPNMAVKIIILKSLHASSHTDQQEMTNISCHIEIKITTPNFKPSHTLLKNVPVLFSEHSLSVLRGWSVRNKRLNKTEKENEREKKQTGHTHSSPLLPGSASYCESSLEDAHMIPMLTVPSIKSRAVLFPQTIAIHAFINCLPWRLN